MEYDIGTIRFDEIWYTFSVRDSQDIELLPPDSDVDPVGGWDFEVDILTKLDGVWRLGDVRVIFNPYATRSPTKRVTGEMANKVREHVSRYFESRIQDKVDHDLLYLREGMKVA